MATATVEEVQLLKTLRWWDGFVIALCNPGFLLGSLGFTLGIFGVVGSMILWGCSAAIGLLQAWIYSEPATMFGHRSGGIALYAHEGWRKYTTLVGPLSAFGYWIGWSVVLSIFGKIIGDLATSQWWPNSHLSIGFLGNTLTLSSFIAIGCIIFVWSFNIFGLRPAVWFTYACAALLMVPLALFIIVPYFTRPLAQLQRPRDVHRARGAGSRSRSSTCSSSPGRRTARRRVRRSRLSTSRSRTPTRRCGRPATFMLLVCLLLPLGLGGVDGVSKAVTTGAEGQFYTQAMGTLVGHGAASFFTICIIASLLLSMTSSTSDAGRALFGISRAGMTIKQFGVLNRFHVPGRAMTLDLFVNIALVLVDQEQPGDPVPQQHRVRDGARVRAQRLPVVAPRPAQLAQTDQGRQRLAARGRVPVRAELRVPGRRSPGAQAQRLRHLDRLLDRDRVLVGSLILFVFRRVVQDGEGVHLREDVPAMPSAEEQAELGITVAPSAHAMA